MFSNLKYIETQTYIYYEDVQRNDKYKTLLVFNYESGEERWVWGIRGGLQILAMFYLSRWELFY